MSELVKVDGNAQVFNNPEFGMVRTSGTAENPMFCLADLCRALDLTNPSMVTERLDPKGVTTTYTLTSGGYQKLLYVNEPNLYRCIFQSRKRDAIKFQDWVYEEVLPAIRKTGRYGAGSLSYDEIIYLAHQELQRRVERQGKKIAELQKQVNLKQRQKRIAEKSERMIEAEKWIDAKCKHSDTLVAFSVIWNLYIRDCEDKEIASVSDSAMGKLLTRMGYGKVRKAEGMYYNIGVE